MWLRHVTKIMDDAKNDCPGMPSSSQTSFLLIARITVAIFFAQAARYSDPIYRPLFIITSCFFFLEPEKPSSLRTSSYYVKSLSVRFFLFPFLFLITIRFTKEINYPLLPRFPLLPRPSGFHC